MEVHGVNPYTLVNPNENTQMKKTLTQIIAEKKAQAQKEDNRTQVEIRLADKKFASVKIYKGR